MISLTRINAIFLQEWYISKRALEVIMDLLFFSIIDLTVFGFIALSLLGSQQPVLAHYMLVGVIFWEVIRVTQYSMTVSSLWNVWSRNLSNMFITPLSLLEYVLSQMFSGAIKSLVICLSLVFLTIKIYDFNIFILGWPSLLFGFINLVIFSWSIGLILLGLIFRFGTRVQALGWAAVFIFQPLSATFFPVAVLPTAVQKIAYCFPTTYTFEALRFSVDTSQVQWPGQLWALGLNIIYFILAAWLFNRMFDQSRDTGQFARNES